MTGGLAIQARDLTRRFGGFVAVDRVTFDVHEGEVFGFLGANGAGKTTAIRMLTGLLAPSGGEARVVGYDVFTESEIIKRHIGYMSQRFSLYEDLTIAENIQLYGGIYDLTNAQIRERTASMLARLGLTDAAHEFVRSIPLGWRQKLAFSVALLHQPRIVFLDEPTSGVDPITRRQFWELIYAAAADGHNRVRDHALHGRGGILRPCVDHGRGADRRNRHARRAEAAVWRRNDRRCVRDAGAAGGRDGGGAGPAAMRKALAGLLRKEIYHVLRDRRTLAVITLMPIVQVIIFGYAIRTDVDRVRLAIVDPAPDAVTLELRSRFGATDTFRVAATLPAAHDLEPLFRRGLVQGAVLLEPGFADNLGRGLPANVLIVTDATEPNTGSVVQAYVLQVIQAYERERGARPGAVRLVPSVRMRFNPTRESSNLFVPGLMAFVLTIISSLMTAITITREKETGTMETLLVSPLRPWQIIVGKVAPYLAIGFVSVLGVIVEARLVFNVPLRGSLVLLLAEGLLFILVSLSLGILISARTSSQRVAMMGAMVGTMLPTMLLSGFIFPIESMPWPLRAISNVVPARWFVVVARAIMLKGVGLSYLWRETLVLAVMATVLLVLSTRSFRERLE